MTRAEEIGAFLAREGWGWAERTPLAGDASARRYERLRRGFQRAILMDMPPESGLDVRPFLAVTAWLRAGRFSAPEVLGADRARGLVLLEDLGDDLFATLCAEHPSREPGLYRAAVEALADLQRRPPPGEDVGWTPPPYDLAFLMREVRLVPEWYLPAATGAPVPPDLAAEYDALAATALLAVATPQVPVLRDYHAENLLWLPRRRNHARVGMLDYQDMLLGHPAYDLISLLEDARRDTTPRAPRRHARPLPRAHRRRPRDLRRRSEPPRRPAQPQDPRPLHPPLPPRRQAALPRAPPARLGAPDRATSHTPPSRPSPPSSPATSPPPPGSPRPRRGRRMTPQALMIFAAGLGTRMGALTRDRPKPLVEVAGRPLIDHALALARAAGIPRIVVNTHAHADQMQAHLARTAPDVLISHEPTLLETGGGLKRALPLLGPGPVFTLNADMVWTGPNPLAALAAAWTGPTAPSSPSSPAQPPPATPAPATSSSTEPDSAAAPTPPPRPSSSPAPRSSTPPPSRASTPRPSRSTRSGTPSSPAAGSAASSTAAAGPTSAARRGSPSPRPSSRR